MRRHKDIVGMFRLCLIDSCLTLLNCSQGGGQEIAQAEQGCR